MQAGNSILTANGIVPTKIKRSLYRTTYFLYTAKIAQFS